MNPPTISSAERRARRRHLRFWRGALALYLALPVTIGAGAYLRLLPTELPRFPHADQLGHMVLIGLAAPLADGALGRRTVARRWLPLGPALVAVVACCEELAQALSPVRSCSWLDAGADLAGIVIFTALGRLLSGAVSVTDR